MKWITREKVKVDRVACPWLIKRFIDPQAEFLIKYWLVMKRKLLPLILLACALSAQAQAAGQFYARLTGAAEVPPNNDPTIGTAQFTLTGDILDFYVYVPGVTFITQGGTVNGPAPPGVNGSIIFDLGGFVFHRGSTLGDPPFYSSASPAAPPFGAGPFTLSQEQIDQLESGLWYVSISSGPHPEGQLRGQILPVPEPSIWALLILAGGLFGRICAFTKSDGNVRFSLWHRIQIMMQGQGPDRGVTSR